MSLPFRINPGQRRKRVSEKHGRLAGLAKVKLITIVSDVSILGWAAASQQKALDNARAAAVECSRRRVERAEVAQAVAALTAAHAVPFVTTRRRDRGP